MEAAPPAEPTLTKVPTGIFPIDDWFGDDSDSSQTRSQRDEAVAKVAVVVHNPEFVEEDRYGVLITHGALPKTMSRISEVRNVKGSFEINPKFSNCLYTSFLGAMRDEVVVSVFDIQSDKKIFAYSMKTTQKTDYMFFSLVIQKDRSLTLESATHVPSFTSWMRAPDQSELQHRLEREARDNSGV